MADTGAAASESTGLVECDSPDVSRGLEKRAPLDEDSVACRGGQPGNDADRSRDDQRTRAGDNEHDQCLVEPLYPGVSQEKRRNDGDEQGQEHHQRRIDHGEALHPLFGRSSTRLSFFHHADDAGKGSVRSGLCGSKFKRSLPVDRARENLVSRPLPHGKRFSRDGCLVYGRLTPQHHAVERYFLPGANQYCGVKRNGIHRFFFGLSVEWADVAGCLRSDLHECLDGAAGPPDTPGFEQKGKREEKCH